MKRRQFCTLTAMGAAGTLLPSRDFIGSALDVQLKKAVLITMLPKEMSYFDRFRLAVDVGFEAVEAQTVEDPRRADAVKAASDKAKLRIHSVMNMDHWRYPLSSSDPAVVEQSIKGMQTSLRN